MRLSPKYAERKKTHRKMCRDCSNLDQHQKAIATTQNIYRRSMKRSSRLKKATDIAGSPESLRARALPLTGSRCCFTFGGWGLCHIVRRMLSRWCLILSTVPQAVHPIQIFISCIIDVICIPSFSPGSSILSPYLRKILSKESPCFTTFNCAYCWVIFSGFFNGFGNQIFNLIVQEILRILATYQVMRQATSDNNNVVAECLMLKHSLGFVGWRPSLHSFKWYLCPLNGARNPCTLKPRGLLKALFNTLESAAEPSQPDRT
ncbi:uncharacterized protein G2W53_044466 [Senna tora]|uniref:Uncharacterized protein n=1 Tax=Senna tora TaxID=362788 RepID=A0A834VXU0_9FABA|nr:uncharacterized protein G2W53_044466 [Senna tora]